MERLYILYRFFYADFLVVLINIQQMILVISHPQLFHVGELAQAVAGLHALYQGVMVMLAQGVYQIYGSLIHGQDVGGGYNTDVRGDYRLCCHAFAVAGYGHVAKDVDIYDLIAEMIKDRFGGLGHALHEFFFGDAPLVVGSLYGVNPFFPDASVCAADADVLIGSAEAAHGMSLKMSQGQEGVVVCQVLTYGHFFEPFAAFNREQSCAVLVHDVYGAEGPAVDLQGLPVRFGGVAVAFVVSVSLDDIAVRDIVFDEGLYPRTRNDVRAVLFAGVQLDGYFAGQVAAYFLEYVMQSFCGEVFGEVYGGFVAGALLLGNIVITAGSGCFLI